MQTRESATAFPKRNNFDLIRLFAALQVAVSHSIEHLGLRLPAHETSLRILSEIPGVPIFFFISGFLIVESYRRAPSLKDYAINRALRILPALWLVFFVAVGLALLAGYPIQASPGSIAIWAVSQLTFLQFYNPDFMRGYGNGVLNGSLWTIPVEMQFYLLVPVLFWLTGRFKRLSVATLVIAGFMLLNLAYIVAAARAPEGTMTKLAQVSFLPWFYMFLTGGLIGSQWERMRGIFEDKALWWLLALGVSLILNTSFDLRGTGNILAPPWALLLGGTIIACAFSWRGVGPGLLRGNDISYGLYIFHVPVINFLIATNGPKWAALPGAVGLAAMSWLLIEKPALSLKRRALLRRS